VPKPCDPIRVPAGPPVVVVPDPVPEVPPEPVADPVSLPAPLPDWIGRFWLVVGDGPPVWASTAAGISTARPKVKPVESTGSKR
jgi:hypothetical protein